MVPTLGQLRARRDEILAVAARHGARKLRVFGSVARGDADETSDLNVLVDMDPGRRLLDLAALEQDLGALLGCRVEAGTTLRPAARRQAERDVVPL